MERYKDSHFLRRSAYANSSKLNARAELHRRFSTNPQGFPRWAYEQFAPYLSGRTLEVGSGPGWLWQENAAHLPETVHVCLSDLSMGMLREARQGLGYDARFGFANLDVQALPLPSRTFRLIVANHMLYHVPDLPRAAAELARVLAPGGRLFAGTNGPAHLHELTELVQQFEPQYDASIAMALDGYNLENAAERLSTAFDRVEVLRFPDSLWVTEAQPLADYVLSLSTLLGATLLARGLELRDFFDAQIQAEGGIPITKDAGLAIASIE